MYDIEIDSIQKKEDKQTNNFYQDPLAPLIHMSVYTHEQITNKGSSK